MKLYNPIKVVRDFSGELEDGARKSGVSEHNAKLCVSCLIQFLIGIFLLAAVGVSWLIDYIFL